MQGQYEFNLAAFIYFSLPLSLYNKARVPKHSLSSQDIIIICSHEWSLSICSAYIAAAQYAVVSIGRWTNDGHDEE